jgi:GTP-binding protein EngB required for normal cell division
MKKMILVSLALLLAFAVIPAMAGEKAINNQDSAAFQALSKLSVPGQTVLNKMTDDQLAKVEGQSGRSGRSARINIAIIRQRNTAIFACVAICGAVSQTNNAVVIQD